MGREAERAQIERLLGDAAAGDGGALVLRGEAGVGKTALLEQAMEAVEGFRILCALGVESEAELPFAALHELVAPVVGLIQGLPEPQSKAMQAALALAEFENLNRFSAYAATLGLLAAAAAERPVLCVLDDAHWLDQASTEALVFAARRIDHDPIVMLFAIRDPAEAAFSAPGLTELRIDGLPVEEAKALLAVSAPSLLPAVVEQVVETAGGNPLALLEFAASATQNEERGQPLPVSEAVERAFLARSSRLSAAAQRALLLAAVCDPSEPEALWAALESEQISGDSLAEAERAGLIVRGRKLRFSHPLARSAIYYSAAPAERRAAHLVLAETMSAADQRTWHLAAATLAPDEQVALALEQVAADARRRAGVSVAATALERAARLTPGEEPRARRLFEAVSRPRPQAGSSRPSSFSPKRRSWLPMLSCTRTPSRAARTFSSTAASSIERSSWRLPRQNERRDRLPPASSPPVAPSTLWCIDSTFRLRAQRPSAPPSWPAQARVRTSTSATCWRGRGSCRARRSRRSSSRGSVRTERTSAPSSPSTSRRTSSSWRITRAHAIASS